MKIFTIAVTVCLSFAIGATSMSAYLTLPPWKSKNALLTLEVSGDNFGGFSSKNNIVALNHYHSSNGIQIWNLEKHVLIATYDLRTVISAQLSKNGDGLFVSDDSGMAHYHIPSTTPEWMLQNQWFNDTFGTEEIISWAYAVNYDESNILTLNFEIKNNNTTYWVNLFKLDPGPVIKWRFEMPTMTFGYVSMAKEAPLVAGAFRIVNRTYSTSRVCLWDFSSNNTIWTVDYQYQYVEGILLSDDGSRLLVDTGTTSIIYSVASRPGGSYSVNEYDSMPAYGARFTPDGRYGAGIIGGYGEGTNVSFYSEASPNALWYTSVPCASEWYYLDVAISGNGNYAAVGGCEDQNRSLFLFKYGEKDPVFVYYSTLGISDVAFVGETELVLMAQDYSDSKTYLIFFDLNSPPLIPDAFWTPILLTVVTIVVVPVLYAFIRKLVRKAKEKETVVPSFLPPPPPPM